MRVDALIQKDLVLRRNIVFNTRSCGDTLAAAETKNVTLLIEFPRDARCHIIFNVNINPANCAALLEM